jgi:glycosyltransferase involved in cell wall biosynthesis
MPDRPLRLAIVTSHVIQYQAPLFRALALTGRVEPHVFFLSRQGLDERLDSDLGTAFAWDVDLLGGYASQSVPNLLERRPVGGFASYLNPSLPLRLRRLRPDAVMLFGLRNPSALAAYAYALATRTPVLYRAESSVLEPAGPVARAVSRLLMRGIDAVVPIGTANDAYYESLGFPASRRFLGPYTVDSALFDRLRMERGKARAELGIGSGEFVVMVASKLVDRKDPLTVVRAAARVSGPRPVRLLVVGDGVLRPRIEATARELGLVVDIRGFLNQTQLGVAYSAADVFVLASLREPWGLVVNEAMHFSLPVLVSSQVGSGLDLVVDGANGSIFPAGADRQLAAHLQELAGSPELAERRGAHSREIIERWNVAATVDGIVRATEAACG